MCVCGVRLLHGLPLSLIFLGPCFQRPIGTQCICSKGASDGLVHLYLPSIDLDVRFIGALVSWNLFPLCSSVACCMERFSLVVASLCLLRGATTICPGEIRLCPAVGVAVGEGGCSR